MIIKPSEADQEVLGILTEECAEVIQAVSKINRFGFDSRHPDGGPDNREHLSEEVGDLLAMVQLLYERGMIDYLAVMEYKEAKRNKLQKWSRVYAQT